MPKNHLLFVVMLVLSSSRSFALDVGTEASPLVASGIDFIFDGGSIEFQFGNADGTKLVLVLVNPKSPFANRIKHPYRILATRGSRFEANEAESLSKEKLEQVLKIMITSTDRGGLHSYVCGVLLAIHAGFEPITWGPDAVKAIEEGRWLSLFQKKVEGKKIAPTADPFK